jgi:hypothetical protein
MTSLSFPFSTYCPTSYWIYQSYPMLNLNLIYDLFTGIVNRGDSFRRRRSRSNSLIPTPTTPEPQGTASFCTEDGLLMPANVSRANSRNNSRRSSRASPNQTPNQSPRPSIAPQPPSPSGPTSHYRVAMIGGREVGKSSLISQFLTSDSINAYDGQDGKLSLL